MVRQNERSGWLTSPSGVCYPPQPWQLGGTLVASVFRVPVRELPPVLAERVPERTRPVVVGGAALVAAAFVHYRPGGVLHYDEVLSCVLVRSGTRPRGTIAHIWVDSRQSRAGGRELWGIPKELADFSRTATGREITVESTVDQQVIASVRARLGPRLLPGWPAVPFATAQRLDGTDTVAHNLVVGRPRLLRAQWTFAEAGPLGHLAGRRPVLSLALTNASITFGLATTRSAARR
ncbi:Acetoacetate decarboxylase (ADC) [Goodfellowiella coeruleoviolacea]|uniref:Acetoacetate decarboxylase (ADC) n=1 Tax=Goodfellowiella coeruleoviolacea TaxID=334858 RepID=A0AAE3GD60_9PSEU|nr:Acetoacetate decarboxylase (ADC) [Goodfellowiella coeruleoviolacea]